MLSPFSPGTHLFSSPSPSLWSSVPCSDSVSPILPGGPIKIFHSVGGPIRALHASPAMSSCAPCPFLDSGATAHITGDLSLFIGPPTAIDIPIAGIDPDSTMSATFMGPAFLMVMGVSVYVPCAFYVAGIRQTLVSVRSLLQEDIHASCTFRSHGVMLDLPQLDEPLWVPSGEGLYDLPSMPRAAPESHVHSGFLGNVSKSRRVVPNTFTGTLSFADLMHSRCGHVSWGNRHLAKAMSEAYGSTFDIDDRTFCGTCPLAKMHQIINHNKARRKATRPLERVHFDISPAIPTMGAGGAVGYLLLVDEFTDEVFVYMLHRKSDVMAKLQQFQVMAERHFQTPLGSYTVPHTLSCFRSDNAGEHTSKEMCAWLTEQGIQHELSAPYCQWQDCKAERFIRTVWEGAEAMRKHAGAPARFWPYALRAFVHARSLLPRRKTTLSPWEAWRGIVVPLKDRLAHLRSWGCRCFVFVPKELRKKLDDKARECVFLGYDGRTTAYVAIDLITGDVIVSPHVVFDETTFPFQSPSRPGVVAMMRSTPKGGADAMQVSDWFSPVHELASDDIDPCPWVDGPASVLDLPSADSLSLAGGPIAIAPDLPSSPSPSLPSTLPLEASPSSSSHSSPLRPSRPPLRYHASSFSDDVVDPLVPAKRRSRRVRELSRLTSVPVVEEAVMSEVDSSPPGSSSESDERLVDPEVHAAVVLGLEAVVAVASKVCTGEAFFHGIRAGHLLGELVEKAKL